MLSELTIENVAVIEKACVQFGPGLNVLTGETGAGKSILIDSINAILGNRTSRELVRTGAQKASIWALFTDIGPTAAKELGEAGYAPDEGEILLCREISAEGKSSCRINGRPATATVLRQIGQTLINIHGQHDNQTLLCAEKHLSVLDAYAQNEALRQDYYESYKVLRDIVRQLKALSMDDGEKQRRLDILRYETEEITAARLRDGEEELLMEQRDRIRNAEKIVQALSGALAALNGGDEGAGVCDLLGGAMQSLGEISGLSGDYRASADRMTELYYTAQELAGDLSGALADFEYDPAMLDEIEDRLDLIHKLKRKYGDSIAQILAYGEKAAAELESISFSEEKIEKLTQQRVAALAVTRKKADALTENRLAAFARFSGQIAESLRFLNMPGIQLQLDRHATGKLGPAGQDELEFLISTNPGEPPKPLSRIASGGELSRIMLAIKSAMADKDDIDTVIYDEIDTGVSGLAAGRIGSKLKETSHGRQVICVTHTAQIAAQADRHLLIAKSVADGRAYTQIHELADSDRERELARIISGDQITELALANAKEMLQLARA